jgi:predicted DnaQ family exonuclease/DinG family helicase
MGNITSFVALDIETTGLDFKENEIIEIGAVKYIGNQKKETFSCFLRIQTKLPLFIKQLTHITDEMLNTGKTLKEALKELKFFISDLPVVCHNVSFDIGFINEKLSTLRVPKITNSKFDTVELARIYLPFITDHKLTTVSQFFSVSLSHAHRALYDAEATAEVYLKLMEFIIANIPLRVNYFLWELAKISDLSTDLVEFLKTIVDEQNKTALLSKISSKLNMGNTIRHFIEHKPENAKEYSIKEIFAENGVFAKNFHEYEIREGQIQMAEAVLHHFQQEEFLMVEAGTGVGKSFAYLIPALLNSLQEKGKVVISTNTKNLQEQLFNKDIPFLKDCLALPFQAVLLKGRRNYLCEKRWQERTIDFAKIFSANEARAFMNLIVWKEFTQTGDISENSSFNEKRQASVWKELAADRHFCRGKKCALYGHCYLMNVRRKTEKASIVVINHHLLLADLKQDKSTFGNAKYLIIDEAHNLPAIVSDELGLSLSYTDFSTFFFFLYSKKGRFQSGILVKLKTDITKSPISANKQDYIVQKINQIFQNIDELIPKLKDFFKIINQIVKEKGNYGKLRLRNFEHHLFIPQFVTELLKWWGDFSEQIMYIQNTLKDLSPNTLMDYDINVDNVEMLLNRCHDFQKDLMSIYKPDLQEFAFWLSNFITEDTDFPGGIINYAPLECQKILNDTLYQNFASIIFTSATLALREKFTFFSQKMGLDWLDADKVQELVVPSPFDFKKQAVVIVPTMLPDPRDKFFSSQSIELIWRMLEISQAGAMILFTSYKDLNHVYEALEEPLFQKDILLLAQGKGSMSRSAMLEEFKINRKSILLATNSFWEGVDVPGDSLSLLILYKLPFLVPSEPIVEAYIEKLEADGKNSFMHYMVPNALLKYRQGFGRLIRNKTDKGMVIVLDNRIKTKTYGHYFMEIVPSKTIFADTVQSLDDYIGRWFALI